MTRISPQDITTHLPSILSRVAQGEEFVVTDHGHAVARIVPPLEPAVEPARDSWQSRFDDWMTAVEARAGRYPVEFTLDDTRETIYRGRGA
jgi:antitoxin (DNA-binding transcriptional repressor) of toxin-antitoxin stability system